MYNLIIVVTYVYRVLPEARRRQSEQSKFDCVIKLIKAPINTSHQTLLRPNAYSFFDQSENIFKLSKPTGFCIFFVLFHTIILIVHTLAKFEFSAIFMAQRKQQRPPQFITQSML